MIGKIERIRQIRSDLRWLRLRLDSLPSAYSQTLGVKGGKATTRPVNDPSTLWAYKGELHAEIEKLEKELDELVLEVLKVINTVDGYSVGKEAYVAVRVMGKSWVEVSSRSNYSVRHLIREAKKFEKKLKDVT